MILIADQYRLEDARKKLAGGLAQLRPEHCPADRTALVFAETLLEGGHFDEAERYLTLVDGKADFAARALEIRLRSLVMRNRADEAVELARMTPEGVATEPGVLLWLARAHEKRGDHREAIDRYREFIELTPEAEEAPGAALMAGLMALNLRSREEAHGFFQTTITRYPASREAERARHFLVGQP